MTDLQKMLKEFEDQMQEIQEAWKAMKEAWSNAVLYKDGQIEIRVIMREEDLSRAIQAGVKSNAGVARIGPESLFTNVKGRTVTGTLINEKEGVKRENMVDPVPGVTVISLPDTDESILNEIADIQESVHGKVTPTAEDIARGVLAEDKEKNAMVKPVETEEVKGHDEKEANQDFTQGQSKNAERREGSAEEKTQARARFVDKQPPIEYHEAGVPIDGEGDGRVEGVARAKIRRGPSLAEEKYGKREKHRVDGQSGFGLSEDEEE